jgi:hypothetical protein
MRLTSANLAGNNILSVVISEYTRIGNRAFHIYGDFSNNIVAYLF